jgi:ABC-type uncharacterized transport system substrate-binding protein
MLPATNPKVGIIHSGSDGPGGGAAGKHDSNIKALQDTISAAHRNLGGSGNINYHNNGKPLFADDSLTTLRTHADTLLNPTHGVNVNLLIAAGGTTSAQLAKEVSANLTLSTPIVFTSVGDPDLAYFANSNMTGVYARTSELDVERLKLLHELRPNAAKFGVLYNSKRPYGTTAAVQLGRLNDVARALDIQSLVSVGIDPTQATPVGTQIDQAFQVFSGNACEAVLVTADPLLNNNRDKVVKTGNPAAVRTPPAVYQWTEFLDEDGFMSYGPNLRAAYQLAGIQAARIIKNLEDGVAVIYPPVLPMNNFELTINLKNAPAGYGITDIPASLLSRADKILF